MAALDLLCSGMAAVYGFFGITLAISPARAARVLDPWSRRRGRDVDLSDRSRRRHPPSRTSRGDDAAAVAAAIGTPQVLLGPALLRVLLVPDGLVGRVVWPLRGDLDDVRHAVAVLRGRRAPRGRCSFAGGRHFDGGLRGNFVSRRDARDATLATTRR